MLVRTVRSAGALLLFAAGCSWLVDGAGLTGSEPPAPNDASMESGASADGDVATDARSDGRSPTDAGEGGDVAHIDGAAVTDGAVIDAESGAADDAAASARAALIGEWLFDQSAPVDTSGHGNDGTFFGAGAIEDGGVRGGALYTHDGGGMTVSSLALAAFPSSGTVAMWIKSEIPATDTELRGVFDSWDGARTHVYLRKTTGAPLSLQVALQSNDAGFAWVHTFVVSNTDWVHVALTWDSAADLAVFYLGGVEAGRKSGLAGFDPKQQLVDVGGMFNGAVDEARLFDRALTAAEIATLP